MADRPQSATCIEELLAFCVTHLAFGLAVGCEMLTRRLPMLMDIVGESLARERPHADRRQAFGRRVPSPDAAMVIDGTTVWAYRYWAGLCDR